MLLEEQLRSMSEVLAGEMVGLAMGEVILFVLLDTSLPEIPFPVKDTVL